MAAKCTVLAFSALAVFAQKPLPEWVMQVAHIRVHYNQTSNRIPNYVCRETIDRFQKLAQRTIGGSGKVSKIDRLEFDVAKVDDKELLAPPGSGGFEDVALSKLVPSGILGTGDFAALPHNILTSSNTRITPHKTVLDEVEAGAFDFDLSMFDGFQVSTRGGSFKAGQRGVFRVDLESLDLLSIEAHAVDLPPRSMLQGIASSAQYARMQIGTAEVTLPKSAVLTVIDLNGNEFRNEITFSNCRAFSSESTIQFGDPATAPPPRKK
jgi:hypothetical protein